MAPKYQESSSTPSFPLNSEEIPVYLLVCKNDSGAITVPPFTAFEEEEAQNYFDENSYDPGQILFGHTLLRIIKAFIIRNGEVIWANREGIRQEKPYYITLDFNCHGIPSVYFRSLLSESEVDLNSKSVARIC